MITISEGGPSKTGPWRAAEPQASGLSPGGPKRSGGGAKRLDQGARRRLAVRALVVVTAFPFPSCLGVRRNGNGNPSKSATASTSKSALTLMAFVEDRTSPR